MLKPIINPARGKLRVLGYCSGSGNTLWKALELQLEMEKTPEGCPFEVVGIFADNPESKAVETAKKYGIDYKAIDIRKYYAERNKPMKDREVRAEFDAEAMEMLECFDADMILLAGYVWATTDAILERYLVVNVHPADLALIDENGQRPLAGANGIKAAFNHNMDYLRASSHLATKELDAGALLVRSPKIPVDYTLHEDDETRFRHYLKLINEQSRLVGSRTVLELALGHFTQDENGKVHHKGRPVAGGLTFEDWQENVPNYLRKTNLLLSPKSVAVIGASQKPGIGRAIVENLLNMGYKGTISAVNLRGEDVQGCTGYTSVLDIETPPDLAVLSVPSSAVLQAAEECGKKGVSALICITAGFREIGGPGIEREAALLDIVNRYNMRMIGPNCMGVANTDENIRLSATILSDTPRIGSFAFLTQSGALGASMMDFAQDLDIGFSAVVSLGNMADVNICDLLPILQADDNTKLICLYMETIPQPHLFEKIMKKITKPVIMVKSGRSSSGAAAASSHTGSLSGNDQVVDAFLEKCGVIRAQTLEDAFLLVSAMLKMPKLKGRNVGIISNAGGLGTVTCDSLEQHGFSLPQLSETQKSDLATQLLPEASTQNPIDLVASAPPEHYTAAAQAMVDSGLYDALIIDCVPPAVVDTGKVASAVNEVLKKSGLPVFSCFFGPRLGLAGSTVMREAGIPNFNYPNQMVRTMNYMVQPTKKQTTSLPSMEGVRGKARKLLADMPAGCYLPPEICFALLELYGIPVAKSYYVKTNADIDAIAFQFPLVAKIDHPEIVHKSDVGGVRLNLQNKDEIKTLLLEWQQKFSGLRGIHLQQQIDGTLEMIIGASRDDALGHSILLGMGGVLVELLRDVSLGHIPLSAEDPQSMIDHLRCKPLLEGYRGSKETNTMQLKEVLLRINQLLLDFPNIDEMDVNPLIYHPQSDAFIAVDARIAIG